MDFIGHPIDKLKDIQRNMFSFHFWEHS